MWSSSAKSNDLGNTFHSGGDRIGGGLPCDEGAVGDDDSDQRESDTDQRESNTN